MSWAQLKQINDDNRRQAEEEKRAPVTKCPVCAFVPLRKNKDGVLLCPMGDWRSDNGG